MAFAALVKELDMVRGIGFRIPMKEAVRMTVATEAGFARLLGMFKPGDNYLVVLPSEGSNEVNYVRTAGLGEEWDESVREGGPPHVIIESFWTEPSLSTAN